MLTYGMPAEVKSSISTNKQKQADELIHNTRQKTWKGKEVGVSFKMIILLFPVCSLSQINNKSC